ncbi:MAG: hypothetical protein DIZ80_11770 [endosymbiont of Galathealinum brachiosum]|uniref:Uncharacterized protein n=1 Tax=endosymbiont of Galathealinum brachiosum TaxID=2200906 RepID=A0A370DFK5_9GAMM|nr:MAG: hypothetical protein DIZ80_11770 [endosymbiont of Galathealinum brachiosum]
MLKAYYLALIDHMLLLVNLNAVATFVYDEALDGDISTASIPTFNFMTGDNRVTGTASFDLLTTLFSSDFDYLKFTIPDNTLLSNATYSFNLVSNEGG